MKTIKIKIKQKPVARGHQSHRSGAGVMADRRMGRLKTRQARNKQAIDSYV